MNRLFRAFVNLLPETPVYAHCDLPCGIYDPHDALQAAQTVLVMTQKMTNLATGSGCLCEEPEKKLAYTNTMTRMIMVKEKHAKKCKKELLTLWTDYFKPEHLEKFPDLHDTFWKAAKLCSKTKQEVSIETAEALVKACEAIAKIFEATHPAGPNPEPPPAAKIAMSK